MCLIEANGRNGAARGILFAADSGQSLDPMTQVTARGLIPVYDKPMIYYPLSMLILAGIQDVLVICPPRHLRSFMELLGNGSHLGISISYAEHPPTEGTGKIFVAAQRFIGRDSVCLIFADAILHGASDSLRDALLCEEGATIFASRATIPNQHPADAPDTIEIVPNLEEEVGNLSSDYSAIGLYVYSSGVVELTKSLLESHQDQIQIADVNREYFQRGELRVRRLSHDVVRLEVGTASALLETAGFIACLEKRRGLKIGCIEEASFRMGLMNAARLERIIRDLPNNSYREYLLRLLTTSSEKESRRARESHPVQSRRAAGVIT